MVDMISWVAATVEWARSMSSPRLAVALLVGLDLLLHLLDQILVRHGLVQDQGGSRLGALRDEFFRMTRREDHDGQIRCSLLDRKVRTSSAPEISGMW